MTKDDGRLAGSAVEWRHVPAPFDAYEVSSDGRVRRDGRELAGCVDRYGYRQLLLCYPGVQQRFRVHRLVCAAFHGSAPEGHEVAHGDGNRSNNRADNLRWATRSENIQDAQRHGTIRRSTRRASSMGCGRSGFQNGNAKLVPEQVGRIRALRADGLSIRQIAAHVGASRAGVHRVVQGKSYVD